MGAPIQLLGSSGVDQAKEYEFGPRAAAIQIAANPFEIRITSGKSGQQVFAQVVQIPTLGFSTFILGAQLSATGSGRIPTVVMRIRSFSAGLPKIQHLLYVSNTYDILRARIEEACDAITVDVAGVYSSALGALPQTFIRVSAVGYP